MDSVVFHGISKQGFSLGSDCNDGTKAGTQSVGDFYWVWTPVPINGTGQTVGTTSKILVTKKIAFHTTDIFSCSYRFIRSGFF
jgi:hypothetical protein